MLMATVDGSQLNLNFKDPPEKRIIKGTRERKRNIEWWEATRHARARTQVYVIQDYFRRLLHEATADRMLCLRIRLSMGKPEAPKDLIGRSTGDGHKWCCGRLLASVSQRRSTHENLLLLHHPPPPQQFPSAVSSILERII